jgi:hypothetical protein
MRLVAVDPGLVCTGWATYDLRDRELCEFEVIRSRRTDSLDARIAYVLSRLPEANEAAAERMQHRGQNSRGSAQKILDLQLLAGAIGGKYPTRWLRPQDWKATLPIDVYVARLLAAGWFAPHADLLRDFSRQAQRDAAASIGIGRRALGLPIS